MKDRKLINIIWRFFEEFQAKGDEQTWKEVDRLFYFKFYWEEMKSINQKKYLLCHILYLNEKRANYLSKYFIKGKSAIFCRINIS